MEKWLIAGLGSIGSRGPRRNILLCQKVKEVFTHTHIHARTHKTKTKQKWRKTPTDHIGDYLSTKMIKYSDL